MAAAKALAAKVNDFFENVQNVVKNKGFHSSLGTNIIKIIGNIVKLIETQLSYYPLGDNIMQHHIQILRNTIHNN